MSTLPRLSPSDRVVLYLGVAVLVAFVLTKRDSGVTLGPLVNSEVRRRLYLVADEHGNEVLLVDAHIGSHPTIFMVDTAYAGAPVVSTTFLASTSRECASSRSSSIASSSPLRRVQACLRDAREGSHREGDTPRLHAIDTTLIRATGCRAYTSGCTMRLMGIGETVENQADMLLCPALRLDGRADDEVVQADILVSNPLRGAPHILTMDYLLHRAPCVLMPARGEIVFRAAMHTVPLLAGDGFETLQDTTMVGGAFVVPMSVGGTTLHIVLDTGAGATLSLSSEAVDRVRACRAPSPAQHLTQLGVNGERVCSDLLMARVIVGRRIDLGEVALLANDRPVQGADGYAGMGLLRALDMRFEVGRVGVRPSGLLPRLPAHLSDGSCEGRRAPACTIAPA